MPCSAEREGRTTEKERESDVKIIESGGRSLTTPLALSNDRDRGTLTSLSSRRYPRRVVIEGHREYNRARLMEAARDGSARRAANRRGEGEEGGGTTRNKKGKKRGVDRTTGWFIVTLRSRKRGRPSPSPRLGISLSLSLSPSPRTGIEFTKRGGGAMQH